MVGDNLSGVTGQDAEVAYPLQQHLRQDVMDPVGTQLSTDPIGNARVGFRLGDDPVAAAGADLDFGRQLLRRSLVVLFLLIVLPPEHPAPLQAGVLAEAARVVRPGSVFVREATARALVQAKATLRRRQHCGHDVGPPPPPGPRLRDSNQGLAAAGGEGEETAEAAGQVNLLCVTNVEGLPQEASLTSQLLPSETREEIFL
mmetsp:Transcript_22728/g.58124  ORF Transcript_22728/g.58124 Transcript_22728/m.58124 type:complete len:201 (+) Transcript_22728:432-1034(+)